MDNNATPAGNRLAMSGGRSTFSQRLRAALEAADMNYTQLSEQVGVTRAAVSQWAAKDPARANMPMFAHLEKISKATGVTMDFLCNDDADPAEAWAEARQRGVVSIDKARRMAELRSVTSGSMPAGPVPQVSKDQSRRMSAAVAALVQIDRPDLAAHFGKIVQVADHTEELTFCKDGTLVHVASPVDNLVHAIGAMLVCAIPGKQLSRHLVLIDKSGAGELPSVSRLCDELSIKLHVVTSADAAAEICLRYA